MGILLKTTNVSFSYISTFLPIKTRFERKNTKKKYQIQKEKFCNLHVMITVYFIWGWKENNLRMFTSVQYIWGRLWTSDHTHTDIFYFLQTASFHFRPIPRYRQIFAKDKLNFFFWFFFFAHCRQVGDNDQNIYKQIWKHVSLGCLLCLDVDLRSWTSR